MTANLTANASVTVDASAADVWEALTNPAEISEYMMGARVTTDWKKGSPISWKGEFNGKKFEDHGRILDCDPERRLAYTHYSAASGAPDTPGNPHTVTITLDALAGEQTRVILTQDNNKDDKELQASTRNWQGMLDKMKEIAERR